MYVVFLSNCLVVPLLSYTNSGFIDYRIYAVAREPILQTNYALHQSVRGARRPKVLKKKLTEFQVCEVHQMRERSTFLTCCHSNTYEKDCVGALEIKIPS